MKKTAENPSLLAREIVDAGILSAVLSSPRDSSLTADSEHFEKIRIRPVELKTGKCYQLEQFRGKKVFHRNVDPDALMTLIGQWLGDSFSRGEFVTAGGSLQVLANKRGELTALRKNAPSVPATEKVIAGHNRTKQYILKEGIPVPFLIDLGVMTKDGSVIKAKYDKFRQINRFLEFIADVVDELRKTTGEISIIDFGCGKSYLTFAVYYYLSVLQKMPVKIIGLDLKEDVISECSALALKYRYEGLSFVVGDIADYSGTENADMVISLHACDTATDFALARAVRWKARVILAVPCCQHELNGQLAGSKGSPAKAILKGAFKHGIIRERMAALFTDVLRAELLESEGYSVQILEFIDMAHTPKNLLIRAVLSGRPAGKEDGERKLTGDYTAIRDFLGVEPTLEKERFNG